MTSELEAEFQQFWAETAGKVRAYMFCGCANWADADDLVQECYLRVLRGWGQFDGTGSRKAWLFVIARRTRADWFRRKKKRSITVDLRSAHEVSVDSRVDQTESIWQVIGNLNAEQREVIHLRFAAGLSYAQIAQTLGVPVGTVRSRLHRGLKSIKKHIGEWENET